MFSSTTVFAAALTGLLATTQAADLSYNGLAITPQMGWDNWNAYACDVSESLLLGTAKKIVDWGLRDLGYNYIILDDCWATHRGSNGSIMPNMTRFPHGMASVADQLHGMGLKYGMYSSAGEFTCAGYPGSLGHEKIDAETFAGWGVDYLKYDNCYNQGQSGTPQLSYNRYKAMSDALNATGRPILYSLCNWGDDKPWEWGSSIANSWRMSGDIYDNFDRVDRRCPCDDNTPYCEVPGFHCNMLNIANKDSIIQSKAQPGGWNDLDMLEVGNGGMTDSEYVAHMSLWAMLKSPLIMGNNLDKISAQSLSILMNPAVIAINQDPLGSSAQRVWRFDAATDRFGRGEISLWTGALANGDQVVALLNAGNVDTAMNATLADIFIDDSSGAYAAQAWDVYDLWANRMSNASAQALINGTSAAGSTLNGTQPLASNSTMAASYYNATQTSYAAGLAANDTRLFGSKIGTLKAQGTLSAQIPRHGIGFYRLRANPAASRKRDEL